MRLAINLVLLALVAFLLYVLYDSIREPIVFKAEKEKRENAVIDKLIKVRKAQELYRSITGKFAHNFDTLTDVLTNGQFALVSVEGDPDDPSGQGVVYDTSYVPARDSMRALGLNVDSLRYVPYSVNNTEFEIQADTLTYQKTLVNVVEVGVSRTKYLGEYADERFKRYDNSFDPFKVIKFGNMNAPNLSGNWE
ncbi:MAG: hypothetical protein AAFO94_11030 [Bacteroidota bacterium]